MYIQYITVGYSNGSSCSSISIPIEEVASRSKELQGLVPHVSNEDVLTCIFQCFLEDTFEENQQTLKTYFSWLLMRWPDLYYKAFDLAAPIAIFTAVEVGPGQQRVDLAIGDAMNFIEQAVPYTKETIH
ncbi:MAG: hypothetical protein VR70_08080 [Rhodospirillaceae bacterium BRH_c57]|nr:MAG: hypothetical protein VR70_08080 [Rhodospirillaceae bacterium BRH_c57]